MATLSNAQIFRKAAEVIRSKGLYQRGRPNGGYGVECTWTAIYSSSGGHEDPLALGLLAAERVAGKGAGIQSLYDWNDARQQSEQDVIALLDGLAFDEDLKAAAMQASELTDVEPSPSLLKEAVHVG